MGLKNKEGKMLQSDNDVLKQWQECVTELYSDKRNEEADQIYDHEMGIITVDKVQEIIKKLPKGKVTGEDDIPAEFLQCCGLDKIKTLTSIVNQIYSTGEFPDDFLSNIFIPIPKTAKATKCEEYRTICLISHACKIVLHIIKERITPIIEQQLSETQFGFRKGCGTRNAIFVLRTLGQRLLEKKKDLFVCYIDYTKAFDKVNHNKLLQIMRQIGIPQLESRLIYNLYWKQHAKVKFENNMTERIRIEKGVRQGCILSPILFNLYSEMLIREALREEGMWCDNKWRVH